MKIPVHAHLIAAFFALAALYGCDAGNPQPKTRARAAGAPEKSAEKKGAPKKAAEKKGVPKEVAAPAKAAAPKQAQAKEEGQAKPAAQTQTKAQLEAKAKKAIDRGLKWLRAQQAEDGSYGNHPGLTAIVLQAFLYSHRKYDESDGPFISRAVQYLVKLAKPNGAIFDKNLPNYNTALAIMALKATGNPAYDELVKKGQRFLVGIQAAEHNKYTPDNKYYGGIGYGSDERPDLSNLQFALEALADTGYDGDKAVFERAIKFVTRCQNRSESNDQPWAGNDGGFIYAPGESKAGGTVSAGAMTYAGIKSLIYCDVPKTDPRIQDAFKWIQKHWDLQTHPGMGDTGLYYYYQTLAKALRIYGEPIIEDDRGREHDWAAELIEAVTSRQHPEGYWVNPNPKYWEGNKMMATARAILALESAIGLTPNPVAGKAAKPAEAQQAKPAEAQQAKPAAKPEATTKPAGGK